MTTTQELVPFTEDAIRQAASNALWGDLARGEQREDDDGDLVDALYAEADLVGDLFLPERGYLTTEEELERITAAAVANALYSVRSDIRRVFAHELTRVPVPAFVPPPAGAWVAERWDRRGDVRTWHVVSGDVRLHRSGRPKVRARCGHQLGELWHSDGSPIVELVVSDDRPATGACGRCARLLERDAGTVR